MSAKDIVLRPISAADARAVVQREHYSGKVDPRSQVHIGVFLAGSLEGAIQFGPPIDRRKVLPIVRGTSWEQMCELNRMAFSKALPRNSESRALGVAFRLLAKHAPQLKWVLSYADATRCGDGTIYRASGFVLTAVHKNTSMVRMMDGTVHAALVFNDGFSPNSGDHSVKSRYGKIPGEPVSQFLSRVGAEKLPGYQFRYVRFLDPTWVDRLTVPVIPFDKIPPECRMYRGKTLRGGSYETTGVQPVAGGESPTPPLHSSGVRP